MHENHLYLSFSRKPSLALTLHTTIFDTDRMQIWRTTQAAIERKRKKSQASRLNNLTPATGVTAIFAFALRVSLDLNKKRINTLVARFFLTQSKQHRLVLENVSHSFGAPLEEIPFLIINYCRLKITSDDMSVMKETVKVVALARMSTSIKRYIFSLLRLLPIASTSMTTFTRRGL